MKNKLFIAISERALASDVQLHNLAARTTLASHREGYRISVYIRGLLCDGVCFKVTERIYIYLIDIMKKKN